MVAQLYSGQPHNVGTSSLVRHICLVAITATYRMRHHNNFTDEFITWTECDQPLRMV